MLRDIESAVNFKGWIQRRQQESFIACLYDSVSRLVLEPSGVCNYLDLRQHIHIAYKDYIFNQIRNPDPILQQFVASLSLITAFHVNKTSDILYFKNHFFL